MAHGGNQHCQQTKTLEHEANDNSINTEFIPPFEPSLQLISCANVSGSDRSKQFHEVDEAIQVESDVQTSERSYSDVLRPKNSRSVSCGSHQQA